MRNFYTWAKFLLYPSYYYLVANYLLSYAMAVFVDPGHPPKNPEDNITPRCQKCNLLRPERTHHCSICGVCCMRYDHHCPWIANCVGLRNYGYFLKFLAFGFVATSVSTLLEITAMICGVFAAGLDSGLRVLAGIIVLMFTACSVMCTAMMLFSHLPFIRHNETTVESYDNDFDRRQAEKQGLNYEYPYDRGLYNNIREVFGPNILAAILLPGYVIRPTADGMTYV